MTNDARVTPGMDGEPLDRFLAAACTGPRGPLDDAVAAWASAGTRPLVLVAAPGADAAGALARLANARRNAGAAVVFLHATLLPGYAEPPRLLWNLLVQLRAIAALPQPPPPREAALRDVLPNWLARASARGPLWLLVADADAAAVADGSIACLPDYWPPNLRVAVSSVAGPCARHLQDTRWQVLDAAPATSPRTFPALGVDPDTAATVAGLLALARAPLATDTIARLAGAPPDRVATLLAAWQPDVRKFGGGGGWAPAGRPARERLMARYPFDEHRRPRLLESLATQSDPLTAAAYFRQAWRREEVLACLLDRDALAATAAPEAKLRWLAEWSALQAGSLVEALLPVLLVANQALLLAACGLVDAMDEPVPMEWLQRAAAGRDPALAACARVRQAQAAARGGDWAASKHYAGQAAATAQDPDTLANARHECARAAEALGDTSTAVGLYEAALLAQEQRHGPDAAVLLPALANLVAALRASNQWARARTLAERAVAIARRRCGADHPDTATACDQLAAIAYAGADFAAAEAWYRDALGAAQAAFGPAHPATAAALHNLGTVLDARRAFVESEECYRRALAIREAAYGREHEETAATLHNLAATLETTGRLDESERLYRETTDIWERLYGAEHPATLSSLTNLAGVLGARGEYADAEVCYRAAAEGWRRLVGDEHPNTLNVLAELGRLYAAGGKPELAGPLLEHAVDVGRRVLGTADVNHVNSVCALAALWRDAGRPERARELVTATLIGAERKLGLIAPPVVQLRRQLDSLDGVVLH